MNSPSDLELRLEAHFAQEAPPRAPDRVLQTVLRYVHTTPQQRRALRVPWRYSTMPGTLKLSLGAAVLGLALISGGLLLAPHRSGVGAVDGPSPSPSPSAGPPASPVPSPLDTTSWLPFTSARYGYSIRYPADWTLSPGSATGSVSVDMSADSPFTDSFDSPGTSAFYVSSQVAPAGLSEADWIASYSASALARGWPAQCWPADVRAWTPVVVDGQPGHEHAGLPHCDFTEVVAFVGGRLYSFQATPQPAFVTNEVFDPARFDAFLSTITLDPAAADDTPAASPSPSPS